MLGGVHLPAPHNLDKTGGALGCREVCFAYMRCWEVRTSTYLCSSRDTTSSFVHHFKSISEFKLELQSGNTQFGSKSTIFFSCMTLQFDVWPWKTIGHLFYATSSLVHHFVAIGEFKLELQFGNAQFGSKSTIFLAVWPCNLTYDQ